MSWPPSWIVDVAALGDLDRRLQRAREVGERLRHLLRGLQVELVGGEGHLRRRERGLGLHAQQRRVVVVVLLAQVVHVGGGDERAAGLPREAPHRLVDLLLLGQAVALDLEVDVLGPEDLHQLVEVRAGLLGLALDDPLARARGEAAREADDALGVLGQQLEVHPRLAAVQALEEALAGERREVAKPSSVAASSVRWLRSTLRSRTVGRRRSRPRGRAAA